MKLHFKEKLKHKVADFIVESPWFVVAFLSVGMALSAVWTMGFFTILLGR